MTTKKKKVFSKRPVFQIKKLNYKHFTKLKKLATLTYTYYLYVRTWSGRFVPE
jgi:hypothetical protein